MSEYWERSSPQKRPTNTGVAVCGKHWEARMRETSAEGTRGALFWKCAVTLRYAQAQREKEL
jgi:hypothetical protein